MTRDRNQPSSTVRKFRGETVFGWDDADTEAWSTTLGDPASDSRPPRPGRPPRTARRRPGRARRWIVLLGLVLLVVVAGVVVLRQGLIA
jgi:hypothetical protein